jgi:hypothetical protein
LDEIDTGEEEPANIATRNVRNDNPNVPIKTNDPPRMDDIEDFDD